jgi:hypothetical protein
MIKMEGEIGIAVGKGFKGCISIQDLAAAVEIADIMSTRLLCQYAPNTVEC